MDKEYIISIINLMFDLSSEDKKDLENLSFTDLEQKYKLYFLEKSDEMID